MITAEAKAATKKRIEDALSAIATLGAIAIEAAKAEDFITLNIIGNDPSEDTPLNNVISEASEALDSIMEADEEHSKYDERDLLDWWIWTDEQFPDIEPFKYMANEARNDLKAYDSAQED